MLEPGHLISPLERLLHLKRVPMLSGLAGPDAAVIADAASERFFPKGTVVFREGEPVGSVHFVVQGAVVTVRRGARLGRAAPGTAVGGLAVFARDPLGSQVVAEEDTLTLELDKDAVAEVLEDHYPILHHVLREMSRRAIDLLTRFRLDPTAGIPECPVDVPEVGDIDLVRRIFFLRRMSVFQRSSITALAELAREMAQVRFEPGTVLWREGEPSPSAFLVRSGWLRATGSSGVAFRPGPGFPLGALEALGGVPRFYEAVAETPVVALQAHMGVLVDVFEDHFGMAMDYLAVIAQSTLRILDWAAARGEAAPLPT
ncbi:MAG TPA: Crp/Fnr family transcriptional regulator [Vicinamibacteria bacterium]|nr:Crp/Fnr family transcriptional regulator [Vicinamibacteria bacterium]